MFKIKTIFLVTLLTFTSTFAHALEDKTCVVKATAGFQDSFFAPVRKALEDLGYKPLVILEDNPETKAGELWLMLNIVNTTTPDIVNDGCMVDNTFQATAHISRVNIANTGLVLQTSGTDEFSRTIYDDTCTGNWVLPRDDATAQEYVKAVQMLEKCEIKK